MNECLFIPNSVEEAVDGPDSKKWIEAMEQEMNSLSDNDTWSLVSAKSTNKRPLKTKWIFKHKLNEDGEIVRHKARLVVKGYSQKEGIDYTETFAPVARYDTVRSLIAVSTQRKWCLAQFDIKTAFLNGELDKEIFIEQPKGFDDRSGRVCKLNKSLYGLKQAPRAWNATLDKVLKHFGLNQSENDPCLYFNEDLIVVIYVDDGLVASRSGGVTDRLIKALSTKFEITSQPAKFYLGLQIDRDANGSTRIHQSTYTKNLLERFNMENCNKVSTPADPSIKLTLNNEKPINAPYRQIIGGLMYLSIMSRPDITFIVNKLSQFLTNPSEVHWEAARHVLAYLKGTIETGITYHANDSTIELEVFTDADFAMCVDTRKSTSGVVITANGSPVVWFSRKQNLVTDSTTYAEYVAAHDGTCDIIWLRRLFHNFGFEQLNPTPLFCDNEAAINITKSKNFSQSTKHIDLKYHFTKDAYQKKIIDIRSIETAKQKADLFTKPLNTQKLQASLTMLNID